MSSEKRNILFTCYGLGIGGIEKCLVNLLNNLPEEDYDVDLLVMNPEYALKPQIRRNVHFIDAFQYILNTEFTMQEIKKRGGLFRHLDMILPYIDHRIRIKLGLPLWTKFRPLPKTYDIAVAYSQNGLAPYYVIDKVQAKKKVLWYHNGAYERQGKEYERDKRYYDRFDSIVAVSNDCAKVLSDRFPSAKDKILVLRNICDSEAIREDAYAFVPESFTNDRIHIVTVGRMTPEKGADLALEACRQLSEEDRNICWHWVGSGSQAPDIQKKVSQLGLQDRFVLEGDQPNPYPFIRCADIYVQPSYYEAYSTTVMEARVLCKPIITTDVGGMRDQLTDGVTGRIVSISAASIAEAIGALLDDPRSRTAFSEALSSGKFSAEENLKEYRRTVFL